MTKKIKKKNSIHTMQIVLGRLCNLACAHCPVDAGPHCKIDLLPKTLEEVIMCIERFPEINTIELTGGEPGMHNGFMRIIQTADRHNKKIIARTNLTIFLEPYFEDIPEFLAHHNVHLLGSFPCIVNDVVDELMGIGVFEKSIKALQILNEVGYGRKENLLLDLIHYPSLPSNEDFIPPPDKKVVRERYKITLKKQFGIDFNDIYVMLHAPTGRMKKYLLDRSLYKSYCAFLKKHLKNIKLPYLHSDAISIDYNGMIFNCDPAHIEDKKLLYQGKQLDLKTLLSLRNLDLIS
jgi:radical SAM/Cys-rich protein